MVGAGAGNAGGGGGSFDPSMLSGYATQQWTAENYLSIDFFNRLFTAHGTGDTVVHANDMESTITSIEAMFGFWTEEYISARETISPSDATIPPLPSAILPLKSTIWVSRRSMSMAPCSTPV
jgi:hypothetical protein